MTLRGDWGSGTQYAVNDVVRFTDGVVYVCQKVPPVGATPHDTLYWGRYHSQEVISMMIDTFNVLAEATEDRFNQYFDLNGKALILPSSTASSEKRFEITVDDDGDVTATEITE